MKKHSLFKTLAILLLLVVVATYFIAPRGSEVSFLAFWEGTASYLGLGDVLIYFVQSFYHFFDTIVFVLIIGGFYGVLSRIPAYKTLVDSIASKFEDKGKWIVIAVTIIFALLACFTGIELQLFIVVPFVVAIILALGYDKLVAISSTIGAILVGNMAGIFVTFRDTANSYAVSYITFDKFVGLENNFSNIIPKSILLVLVIGLLVFYILRHIKKVGKKEVSYDLGEKIEFTKVSEKDSKVSLWPVIVMGGLLVKYITIIIDTVVDIPDFSWKIFNYASICNFVIIIAVLVLIIKFGKAKKAKGNVVFAITMLSMLIVLILGLMPWTSLFETTLFDEIHTAVIENYTLGEFSIFENVLSSNFVSFGNWSTLGAFLMPTIMLFMMMLVFKFIYNIKFNEVVDGFIDGIKKILPAAFLIVIAYTVLVCSYNIGFLETVIKACDNNLILQLLVTIIGSVLSVDLYYSVVAVFTPVMNAVTEYRDVLAIAFQSLRGLVQLIGPTSILLIVGLTYFDVPYRTWFKYVWRLILGLFIIIFAILLVLAII